MADDDLDAFFEEVSAAEAQAKEEDPTAERGSSSVEKPPTKKAKLDKPQGVVVASSKPVAPFSPPQPPPDSSLPTETSLPSASAFRADGNISFAPPLPPGPPPDNKTHKPHRRAAAGKVWVDNTMDEWPDGDYRLFVGNLSKDVTDQQLYEHFEPKYPSLTMVKIIRDAQGTSKGFGFVSLMEPMECARAMREMDQTWLSSRPIRVKRSDWKDRDLKTVRQKARKTAKSKKKRGF